MNFCYFFSNHIRHSMRSGFISKNILRRILMTHSNLISQVNFHKFHIDYESSMLNLSLTLSCQIPRIYWFILMEKEEWRKISNSACFPPPQMKILMRDHGKRFNYLTTKKTFLFWEIEIERGNFCAEWRMYKKMLNN